MRTISVILLVLSCSVASAQEWIARPAPIGRCRKYSVPVANCYRVTRDPWSGYVYSREYIGTRYEQQTYCEPRGPYNFEPWFHQSPQPVVGYGPGTLRYSVGENFYYGQ